MEFNYPIDYTLYNTDEITIIIKAHFKDNVFEKYNFTRIIRKNTKFHFGFLDISQKTKN